MNFFLKKKKHVFFFVGSVIVALAITFFVEKYGFGGAFSPVPKGDRGVFGVSENEMRTDGFISDGKGGYISERENASLVFSPKGRFVYDIRLDVGDNIQTPFAFSYTRPGTQEEISVRNALQGFMEKRKKVFGSFLTFHVGSYAETVTIRMPMAGTEIHLVSIDNVFPFNPFRWMWMFGGASLLLFFAFFWRDIAKKPEIGFLAMALVCGSVLVYAGPREAYTWDEKIHYDRSVSIARIFGDVTNRPGATPSSYSLKEFSEYNAYTEERYTEPKKKPDIKNISYANIGYFPSAVALVVGETLPLPHTVVFLFGRWFNLFVFSLVVFFAIAKLRSGKLIASTVALLPTSLFLASNYDYDWWVTAFLMLGLAYVFSAKQEPEKKLTVRETIIMMGSFVVGLGPKPIYFPLMLLLFLVPREKFETPERYKKFLIATTLSLVFVVGSFLLPFLIHGPGEGDKRGGSAVNATEQVYFILAHPVEYLGTLFRFMGQYVHPENSVGYTTFFAYLGAFPGLMVAWGILIFVLLTDQNPSLEKRMAVWKFRGLVFGSVFFAVALVCTALYVLFTPVGDKTIAGVQPRYLLPVLFPFLFVIGGLPFSFLQNIRIKKVIVFLSFFFSAGLFFYGVWGTLIIRYY